MRNNLFYSITFDKPQAKYQSPVPVPHPITFRGSRWEYMVQIEAPSTSKCWEGCPSPGGQR